MKDLLDKLSSYNLFNYLLPGTLFAAIAERISPHKFTHDSIIVSLFIFYFIGLVISRIGSLVIEPLLKGTKFVKFAEYKDFIAACRKDDKIELLSEQNNMYRTLAALFLALPVYKAVDTFLHWYPIPRGLALAAGLLALFGLFVSAYKKQTGYITKRVSAAK